VRIFSEPSKMGKMALLFYGSILDISPAEINREQERVSEE
jgi:hypothetical protein